MVKRKAYMTEKVFISDRKTFTNEKGEVESVKINHPAWWDVFASEETVSKAIAESKIDFPSANRIFQDMSTHCDPFVSSRTRKNFRTVNQNLGIIERPVGKYGVDGRLNWDYNILDVRWNPAREIECHLSFYERPDAFNTPETCWEPIESVAADWRLFSFYERHNPRLLLQLKSPSRHAHEQLERLQHFPTPGEMIHYLGGIHALLDGDPSDLGTDARIPCWKEIAATWDESFTAAQKNLADLEEEAARTAELLAKKQAEKEERAAKKAEIAANKAARKAAREAKKAEDAAKKAARDAKKADNAAKKAAKDAKNADKDAGKRTTIAGNHEEPPSKRLRTLRSAGKIAE